jgi:hypothetical protein
MDLSPLLLVAVLAAAPADEPIRSFLASHCVACHSGDKAKAELRFDQDLPPFDDAAGQERWQTVLDQVNSGAMPPKEQPRPRDEELTDFRSAVAQRLSAAGSQDRVVLRRLNRVEYQNTIRDLLGIELELHDLLPEDTSESGFDNVGEALHVSSFLLERYLEAAEKALDAAIVNGPRPPSTKERYSYKDEHQVNHDRQEFAASNKRIFREIDDAVVFFSSTYSPTVLGRFYPRLGGRYRFRISAYGFQSPDKPVTFRIKAGGMYMAQQNHLVGYFDAPEGPPTIVEFIDRIEPTNTLDIVPYGTGNEHQVRETGADAYPGAGLAVQWVEVEGPLNEIWPPESHTRLFGDLPQAAAPTENQHDRVEVVSTEPAADARRILTDFARRAFRREVTNDEVRPYLELVAAKLDEGQSFEQAVRVGLAAVMVSPRFLFLHEAPGRLDDFALASRLSYFLWSTMPDEELLSLAEQGKLGQSDVLRSQVERLLASPRAAAFTQNFTGQWLGLRDIDFTEPSHILYPEYDEMLKVSMVRETELFFEEVLRHDLPLTNFVASDFTVLNGRLARHYGIPGVEGWEFHKTALPPGSHRGGLLTMASVLKVTANGTNTSPITRGAWVLDRILGTPPAPPPPGVPALEPDIRGATTIREQLAKHRQIETCASCHARIDPPGFALESFDVIGGWRDNYRSTGNGEVVTIDGRQMPYYKGLPIDPSDVLPDGRAFANIDELKQLLLADPDQLARALTVKLTTYATGGAPRPADAAAIDDVVRQAADKGYGFRSLIQAIVASDLFRKK